MDAIQRAGFCDEHHRQKRLSVGRAAQTLNHSETQDTLTPSFFFRNMQSNSLFLKIRGFFLFFLFKRVGGVGGWGWRWTWG